MAAIKISSKVEKEQWQALQDLAKESHQSISGLLTEAISDYVRKRRLRPVVLDHLEESMTEKTLFIGALVTGAAVLLNPNADLWRGALIGVYGFLGLFLGIFGVCRVVYDRDVPWMAIAGLAVSLAAVLVLL